ncbi:MAG TPA: carboxylesterase/lipase family protein [Bryobacteraceae bacterium]|jgi:para-nitrobenzyl esterase|nr:carboxylesterase/lipase family protein [Bryobacteraceae bacterium]
MKSNIDRRAFLASSSLLVGGPLTKAFAAPARSDSSGPVAQTTSGKIRGTYQDKINAFRGVPYGASTTGSARFMPPSKPQPWTGVRDTLELGHQAPQIPSGLISEVAAVEDKGPMGEDCLMLNVWTPGLGAGHKRPVMVWLHGGGFSTGSGGFTIYDGANLARKHDVVTVTINHRLNVFGFLYLADIGGEKYANASNAGMLDIVAALEWVRDNIANFGGDPANVTIFGQSGGGGKVSTLMAMSSAKGLFHRAIVQSASAIKGVPRADATKSAEMILAKLGLKTNQIDELQNMPMDRVLSINAGGGPAGNQALRLAPVVDGHTLPADPFDPVAPELSANIPLLIGSVETEVTFMPRQQLDPIDDADLHGRVKQAARCDDGQADKIIEAYRKGRPGISNIDLYLILASDTSFRAGVRTEADRKAAQAAQGNAPVYLYYFTWRSPVRDGKLKAFHTLEIPFVFENVDIGKPMTGTGQDRYALSDKMSRAWVAFARTGNPNHKGLPNWPAFSTDQRPTMIFNNECKTVNDPGKEERLAIQVQRA